MTSFKVVLLCYGSPRKQIEAISLLFEALDGVLISGKSGNSDSMNEGIREAKHRNSGGWGAEEQSDWGLEVKRRSNTKDSWSHWEEMETHGRTGSTETFLCVLGHIFWQRWGRK